MKQIDRLPEHYLYSQQSLSAFEQCPLKFRKRYLEGLRWDNALEADEQETLERGRDFHLLARRYFLGLPEGIQSLKTGDEALALWMDHLKNSFPLDPGADYLPEYTLTLRSGLLRLQATLDLVISGKDRLEIWDWKTHSPYHRTKPEQQAAKLEKSLQTRVYLYLLYEQAIRQGLAKDREIHMYYWQPEPVKIIADIRYDGIRHAENRQRLEEKLQDIETYDWNSFDKMLYAKQCKTCEFNWVCNIFVSI